MSKVWIERDYGYRFGWFAMTNTHCLGYAFTKWGAKRIARRYKDRIIEIL